MTRCTECIYFRPRSLLNAEKLCFEIVENHGADKPETLSKRTTGCSEGKTKQDAFKDQCIIKKWIDEGLIKDRYKCYLTEELCFCETSIGCYWRR